MNEYKVQKIRWRYRTTMYRYLHMRILRMWFL